MKLLVIITVALRALWRNKTRSLLTALGIIVGIAAVIAVMALGGGARRMVQAQIDSMGNNMIWVFAGSTHHGGVRGGAGSRQTLTVEDGEAIERECEHVTAMTPQINTSANLIHRGNNWRPVVRGVGTGYPEVRTLVMERGAFFTDSDIRATARVCVLGRTVVDQLFGDEDPVGKTLRVNAMIFRVVGVFARKGTTAWGMDQDDLLIMPWTTANQTIERSRFNHVTQLSLSVDEAANIPRTKAEIAALLRQRHRIAPGGENDFNITDPAEMSASSTQLTKIMTTLLTVIASISLLVGGVGIMNIMLVSVTERTREIGLRLAVGARGRDILLQFLVESVVLSAIGGLLGVGLGVLAARTLAEMNQWPVLVSPRSIALALSVAGGVGVAFGFFPALRASRLRPIESLRYE